MFSIHYLFYLIQIYFSFLLKNEVLFLRIPTSIFNRCNAIMTCVYYQGITVYSTFRTVGLTACVSQIKISLKKRRDLNRKPYPVTWHLVSSWWIWRNSNKSNIRQKEQNILIFRVYLKYIDTIRSKFICFQLIIYSFH